MDLYEAWEIDYDVPHLIELNGGSRTNRGFLVDILSHLQARIFEDLSPFRPRAFQYFNVDVAMAFDLCAYVEIGDENNITCHTDGILCLW